MKPLSKASQQGLHGTLAVPGDKSISHRALMIGSISQGATHIHHFLAGQDCLSTLKAFQDLGVEIERQQDEVIVHGKGMMHLRPASIPLDMGNSGTTTRLMMGLLAGTSFTSTLIGDQSLSKRPMKRVSEPLSELGVQVKLTEKGTLPAQVVGGTVHGKTVKLQVASAQVKSALILAALAADQPTTIIEKLPTRNHTEIMLRQFGAEIETATNQRTITVQPHPDLVGQDVQVPGDMSSAAFFMVAATIIPNSEITLKNVSLNPTRTGILRTMLKMGADIRVVEHETTGEPFGDLHVKTSKLHPIEIAETEIPALIDELPLVALSAATASGISKITGAAELRVKETDRIQAVSNELRKFGVQVEELPDGMIIQGQPDWKVQDSHLDSYGDHRIGMMDVIAALKAEQSMILENEAAISVSYPDFFTDLQHLM